MSTYNDLRRKKSPINKQSEKQFWESKPADENNLTPPDVPALKTKRAQLYLNDESELIQENRKLKETIIQLKLEMKSKLEADLVKQKNEFQSILQEYVQFIDKLMQDKKELQIQLDKQVGTQAQPQEEIKQLLQQIEYLTEENQKNADQGEEFNMKLAQVEELINNLEDEKQQAYERIRQLKQQNNTIKDEYETIINDLKQNHLNDISKFEQIVQEALDKKDNKIQQLKKELQKYQ